MRSFGLNNKSTLTKAGHSGKILIDRFGRSFPYLRLSITDVCNFKCTYCLPDGYKGEAMGSWVDEIRRLIAGFAELGTRKVRLTGGEPTLRKDFLDIARGLANAQIETVAMTTNVINCRSVRKVF